MFTLQETEHAHEDDLQLYVRGTLEPPYIPAVDAHLLSCPTCRERLFSCIGLDLMLSSIGKAKSCGMFKRLEPRFKTGDAAIYQEFNPFSTDRQAVKIVDVSKNGLGIIAPHSTFPGTIAQIKVQNRAECGEVRHSSATAHNSYRIGLRLHGGF